MRPTNLLASLRNMASANLPGKLAWHALEPVLGTMVGFDQSALFWMNEGGDIQDIQIPNEPVVVAATAMFLNSMHAKGQSDSSLPSYRDFMVSGLQQLESMSRHPGYLPSQLYQDVIRPTGAHHMLRMALRQEGVPAACLTLGRERGRDFERGDMAKLLDVLPLVTHLLCARGAPRTDGCVAAEGPEVLVADGNGQIHYASSKAVYLLHRAAGVCLVPGTLSDAAYLKTRQLLQDLARRVDLLERGCAAPIPVHTSDQADGRYLFRAYRLDSLGGGKPMLAVQLEHQLPTIVRLYRAGRLQTLPSREQQIVPLLLRGASTAAIAEELELRRSTVIGYVRNLYLRLGIFRCEDILPALLNGERPAEVAPCN